MWYYLADILFKSIFYFKHVRHSLIKYGVQTNKYS